MHTFRKEIEEDTHEVGSRKEVKIIETVVEL